MVAEDFLELLVVGLDLSSGLLWIETIRYVLPQPEQCIVRGSLPARFAS